MNFDDYTRKLKYPNKANYCINRCKCGNTLLNGLQKSVNYCSNCGKNIKQLIIDEKERYKADMIAYRNEQKSIHERFKKDSLEYVGLIDHKNADKIFDYAWENSRSSGYHAVLDTLEELSELLNRINGIIMIKNIAGTNILVTKIVLFINVVIGLFVSCLTLFCIYYFVATGPEKIVINIGKSIKTIVSEISDYNPKNTKEINIVN